MRGDIKRNLTPVELETLKMVAQGHTYAEIAEKRGVAWQTVKNCMAMVLLRLGARSAAHAIAIAKDRSLI